MPETIDFGNHSMTRREAELIIALLLQLTQSENQIGNIVFSAIGTAAIAHEDNSAVLAADTSLSEIGKLVIELKLGYKMGNDYLLYPDVAAVTRFMMLRVPGIQPGIVILIPKFTSWLKYLENQRSKLPESARYSLVDMIFNYVTMRG